MIYRPVVSTAMFHAPMTDEEASLQAPCEHFFVPLQEQNYVACRWCGMVMWQLIEMVYCDWSGRALEGKV